MSKHTSTEHIRTSNAHHVVVRYDRRGIYATADVCHVPGMGVHVHYTRNCERINPGDLPGSVFRALTAEVDTLVESRFWEV